MITKYETFATQEQDQVIEEYIGSFEPRLYCFESYMSYNLYNSQSMRPFIKNLSCLTGRKVEVGHRFFETKNELEFYLKRPLGLIWRNPLTYGTSLIYTGCHGSEQGLDLPLGLINHDELLEIFADIGKDSSNVLYFSACNVFKNEEFGKELLSASKSRGVIGYKNEVDFTYSVLTDLLFMSHFYADVDRDPFLELQEIFQTTLEEFPVAKEMGLTLFC